MVVVGCMAFSVCSSGIRDISENVVSVAYRVLRCINTVRMMVHSFAEQKNSGSMSVAQTKHDFHGIIDETHHRLYNHASSHHHTRVIPVFYYV